MNCAVCQGAPAAAVEWGCEKPTQVVVWEDEDERFFNCPLRFITQAASEWYIEYSYCKELGCGLPYGDQDARFVDAMREYCTHYARLYKASVRKPSTDSTGKALAGIKASHHGGEGTGSNPGEG